MFFCAAIALSFGFYENPQISDNVEAAEEEDPQTLRDLVFFPSEDIPDVILDYYRDLEFRAWVVDFFAGVCSSYDIAAAILKYADRFDVSPALAFALCWEESKFDPRAINRLNRDGSIDRGLFQLNNRSFPHLDAVGFFDISSNVYYGISHIRYCLDTGGSEISALAMYNAGTGRVRTTGAPEVTLNYVSRILNNKSRIESRFLARVIKEEERRLAEEAEKTERAAQPFFSRTF